MAEKLSDQEIVRRQKMQDLIDKGIKPFGHAYNRTHHSAQLKNLYGEKTKEELEELQINVSVAGRI
ncbi:MAG: lysine--tRNA ligase, partial [Erysipelotrichaceae bacterium]|nr:lysine--tRNA ligase [Erysipelotrichaceae bacterium]